MKSFGIYNAKTHLPQLVERAARGEKILITRHGKPVAMLVAAPQEEKLDVKEVIRQMRELRRREGPTLGDGMTIREMIEEGRRY